jgi:hypothetical protein
MVATAIALLFKARSQGMAEAHIAGLKLTLAQCAQLEELGYEILWMRHGFDGFLKAKSTQDVSCEFGDTRSFHVKLRLQSSRVCDNLSF